MSITERQVKFVREFLNRRETEWLHSGGEGTRTAVAAIRAHRRILDRHTEVIREDRSDGRTRCVMDRKVHPCPDLADVLSIYAHLPGYPAGAEVSA